MSSVANSVSLHRLREQHELDARSIVGHCISDPRCTLLARLVKASTQEEMVLFGGKTYLLTKAVVYLLTQEPRKGDSHHRGNRVVDFPSGSS